MALIELSRVTHSFGEGPGARDVLDDVNLAVEEGEFVSIVGYTGAGKSTLLSIASGLRSPSAGGVLVDGKPFAGFHPRASIVFQNYSLLPWFSALENVRLAVESSFPEWPRRKQAEQAERFLAMVGLGNSLKKAPAQLSGGMRQRVAIARAFATEPRILFLDEPFGALDALTRGNLQEELIKLASAVGGSVTILMITNSVPEAILLSDRIVPMTRGPKATLGPSIAVALARPRRPDLLLHDDAAVHIQSKVVEFLTGFTHAAARKAPAGNAPLRFQRTAEVEA